MRRFITFSALAFFAISVQAADFSMTTNAFLDAGILPVLYTCDGKDQAPDFTWTNPPAKTQEYAFILADPDAPNGVWYHWILYNIPGKTTTIPPGTDPLPAGIKVGKNSWNKIAYNGPCPPKGGVHTYAFTLYALDKKITLPAEATGPEVLEAIKDHILGKVTLTTVYSRWAV